MSFTYDPLGRRLTKHYKETSVIPYCDTGSIPNTREYHHRYLYAGNNIVAIYDAHTDTLLATLLHEENAIDSPLSIHVHPSEPKTHTENQKYESMDDTQQFLFTQSRIKRYYYHKDHQNSIIALSNESAQIVEYYEYDAYGNITKRETMKNSEDQSIPTLNPYCYTGREYDTDDLYYYRARYYDPTLGAFITPDPIGFLGGDMNLHRYVGNDPVNFVDPSGLIVGMAVALASAVKNRPSSSYDGNPFNGIVPNTSAPTPAIPNSTIPQGKTAVSESKPKAVEVKPKNSSTRTSRAKIANPNLKPKEDEKCKDQKWHDPIDNPQLARYSQNGHIKPKANVFGMVRIKNGSPHMHQGVDLLAMPDTPIYACVDGIIANVQYSPPSTPNGANYGHQILLKTKCPTFARSQKKPYTLQYEHEIEKEAGFNEGANAPIYFFYAHLLETLVNIGDDVKAGQIIGRTGTSGYGTSADPHLHFEIRSSPTGNRVNPGFYVKYKLPNELTPAENTNQTSIAQHQQGDPSPLK